jgi:Putative transposase
LHAGVAAEAHQRSTLERLCRYITRPPVAIERLALTPQDNIRYALKTPYRDGTTHVIFEPLDFLARLASLVPIRPCRHAPPRIPYSSSLAILLAFKFGYEFALAVRAAGWRPQRHGSDAPERGGQLWPGPPDRQIAVNCSKESGFLV